MADIHTEPVPSEVADAFRELTGLDVTGIAVHRGPAVSEQARAYQARAFTQSGEIFLPDEAGPLGSTDTRALLAHELTHAVQQRVLSTSLPGEATTHGQELESEANRAEQWYRSGTATPLRLAHLPIATLLAGHAGLPSAAPGTAPGHRVTWSAPTPQSPQAAVDGVQRQPGGQPLAAPASTAPGREPQSAPPAPGSPAPALGGLPGTGTPAEPAGTLATTPNAAATGAGATKLDQLAKHSDRLVEMSDTRPADLDDPESLDELATKVYPRLRGMLRCELLVDRERTGLLADFS